MFCDLFNALAVRLMTDSDTAALVSGRNVMSYHKLGLRVGAMMRALDRSGPGTVLVRGHKEPDVVATMIAATLLDRAFVFAESNYPTERVRQIIDTCDVSAVVNAAPHEDVFPIANLNAFELPAHPMAYDPLSTSEETKVFYITFTSGSTGQPKGIPIRRRNFAALADWLLPFIEASDGAEGACINHASMAFDMSMSDIWPALFLGQAVYLLDHRNNANPHANISTLLRNKDIPAATLCSTPAFLEIMLETQRFNGANFPKLKAFWVGGEEVPQPLLMRLLQAFPKAVIYHSYGPSEVTCVTHCTPIAESDLGQVDTLSLGLAHGAVRVFVDTGDGELRRQGEGEIVLVGPQVADGYLPAEHPNNANFSVYEGERSYHTGDLGRLDSNGAMTVIGRIDRQIKLNGLRIELGAIEQCAMQVPGITAAAVLPPIGPSNVLTLVLAGHSLADVDTAAVRANILAQLPPYMLPGRIVIEPDLPRNLSGKIDRKKLSAQLADA